MKKLTLVLAVLGFIFVSCKQQAETGTTPTVTPSTASPTDSGVGTMVVNENINSPPIEISDKFQKIPKRLPIPDFNNPPIPTYQNPPNFNEAEIILLKEKI